MSDLICRKTLMRCPTPGTCSPHGGCQSQHDRDSSELRRLCAERDQLRTANQRLEAEAGFWKSLAQGRAEKVTKAATIALSIAEKRDQFKDANQRIETKCSLLDTARIAAEEKQWAVERENRRLEGELERLGVNYVTALHGLTELRTERERLEGEVKRLREALRTLLGLVHHKATTPLELESIRMSEAALSTANGEVTK